MHKGIKISLWILFTCSVMVLAAFTSKKHEETLCQRPNISITPYGDNDFLSETLVLKTLYNKGFELKGEIISNINIQEIEEIINHLPEVETAEVYKNIDGTIQIDIIERNPVLRVFNNKGQSFYIDHHGRTMPLSNNFVANTHVATGNINNSFRKDKDELDKNSILKAIFDVTEHIRQDTFLNSQIVQINVDENQEIVLIPRIGEQEILFGNGTGIENKFKRLKLFYKKGIEPHELNKYTTLNLKYKQQIICSKR